MTEQKLITTIRENASLGCLSWKNWSGLNMHFDRNSFWFTSTIQSPIFNTIVELDPESPLCESYLMSIEENLPDSDIPLAWMVPGECTPSQELLRKYHYYFLGSTQGMVRDLSNWESTRGRQSEVVTVDSEEELLEWTRVVASSYQFGPDWFYPWFEMHLAAGFGPESLWEHFLLYEQNKPVAACSLFWGPEVPSLANVAVKPEAMRKGFGLAVTESALSYAKMTMDPEFITLYATEQGLGLYKKLGFQECCSTNIYQRATILH